MQRSFHCFKCTHRKPTKPDSFTKLARNATTENRSPCGLTKSCLVAGPFEVAELHSDLIKDVSFEFPVAPQSEKRTYKLPGLSMANEMAVWTRAF